ncbi:helix-turn-helix transcriptional regulator [Micromonospora sp. WMMD980]|uniref:helix-turn-helix domain-containing protein n=1 Tax=Micromonospora sp. WMMD980 TaxID=3016088 RepID=UPI002416329F|nr:helix-turn-helix transcriptional regulator [Micromonospora sp. WMMD980]MDG4798948.1 helix-turn-helix transcriptional regulator [Micromonospora sp. WMMD980]MDG4798979.1 helix-turn-helix transcriptional regulator [Micromonospora sp. WMMD980]MDG4799014.1 helix-turn-helix transcriptional regulator [Micromonospora sp. WMMD980]
MSAAPTRGDIAASSPIRLRTDVFDRLATSLADTEQDRANLLGLDRATLWRIRKGQTPTLRVAMRIAESLGSTVDELFEVAP